MNERGYSIFFENREARFRQIYHQGPDQPTESMLFTDISRIPVPPIMLIKCWFVLSVVAVIAAIASLATGVLWMHFVGSFLLCEVGYLAFVWRVVLGFRRKIQALCVLAEIRNLGRFQVFFHLCEAIRGHFYVKIVVEPCPFQITPEIQRLLENILVSTTTQRDLYPRIQFHRDPTSDISEPLHFTKGAWSSDELAESKFSSYEEYLSNVVAKLPDLQSKLKDYQARLRAVGLKISPVEVPLSTSSSHITSYPSGLGSAPTRLIDKLLCLE